MSYMLATYWTEMTYFSTSLTAGVVTTRAKHNSYFIVVANLAQTRVLNFAQKLSKLSTQLCVQ